MSQPIWPPSGRLLLVRHGQTEFNASLRFQGQTDTPLNALGQEQARLLGARLASEQIDAAYASDLLRARDTATLAIGERPIAVVQDARLRETNFGRWEGLTYREIQQRFPNDVAARETDRVRYAIPGGESLLDLAARAADFLRDVLPRHPDQTVLVVSHGGTVNALISTLLGVPLTSWWRLRNRNANLAIIELTSSGPHMVTFNDVCHLDHAVAWRPSS